MNDLTVSAPRKLWVRLLLMVLMAAAFQLAASVLFFVAVPQLLLAVVTDRPTPACDFSAAAWAVTWPRLPTLSASAPRRCPSRSASGPPLKVSLVFNKKIVQ